MSTIANVNPHLFAAERSRPGWQAYQILHVAFTVAPILAGLDNSFTCFATGISIWRRGLRGFPQSAATA
jgi:hypothetical protein